MKLVLCLGCEDVVRLQMHADRRCRCGRSGGRYEDEVQATYFGRHAIPIGISNASLMSAVDHRQREGMGRRFEAFVIPFKCYTFRKVRDPFGGRR